MCQFGISASANTVPQRYVELLGMPASPWILPGAVKSLIGHSVFVAVPPRETAILASAAGSGA
jgi:hypothetical protein